MAARKDDRGGKRGKRRKICYFPPPKTEEEALERLRRVNEWMRREVK